MAIILFVFSFISYYSILLILFFRLLTFIFVSFYLASFHFVYFYFFVCLRLFIFAFLHSVTLAPQRDLQRISYPNAFVPWSNKCHIHVHTITPFLCSPHTFRPYPISCSNLCPQAKCQLSSKEVQKEMAVCEEFSVVGC